MVPAPTRLRAFAHALLTVSGIFAVLVASAANFAA